MTGAAAGPTATAATLLSSSPPSPRSTTPSPSLFGSSYSSSAASTTLTTPARSPPSTSPLSPRSPLCASTPKSFSHQSAATAQYSQTTIERRFAHESLLSAQISLGGNLPRDQKRPATSVQFRNNSSPLPTSRSRPTISARSRSSMPDSPSATISSRSSQSHGSQQWWQHVLPPGQLAERLRRAQLSTSRSSAPSSDGVVTPHEGLTPSSSSRAERSAWSSFVPLEKDAARRHSASLLSTSISKSIDTHDDAYGSSVSSDEHGEFSASPSGSGSISPRTTIEPMARSYSQSAHMAWPRAAETMSSPRFRRSTSIRRSRVMSDDGHGSAAASPSTASRDLRGHIQSALAPSLTANQNHLATHLSSEDEASTERRPTVSTSTSTMTSVRSTRTSLTHSSAPSSHRLSLPLSADRVSVFLRPPSGRSSRSSSGRSDDQTSREGSPAPATARSVPFVRDSSSSSRATVQHSLSTSPPPLTDVHTASFAARAIPINRTRMPIRSAPGSRRGSFHADDADRPHVSQLIQEARVHKRNESVSYVMSPEELIGVEEPDLSLLRSLGVAQKQMASASNLSMTLTRQLSAPLRPFIQLAVLMCISTVTFAVLACFLTASYALTGWDDFHRQSSTVGQAAGTARRTVEAGVDWGRRMLTGTALAVGDMRGSQFSVPSTPRVDSAATSSSGPVPPLSLGSDTRRSSSGQSTPTLRPSTSTSKDARPTVPRRSWWLPFGWSSPSQSNRDDDSRRTSPLTGERSRQSFQAGGRPSREAPQALPPRPPLSMLLPSIAFTILLAIGAGLASFFMTRYATAKGKESSSNGESNTKARRAAATATGGTRSKGHDSPSWAAEIASEEEEVLDDDFRLRASANATSSSMRRGGEHESFDSLHRPRRPSGQQRSFKYHDDAERIMC